MEDIIYVKHTKSTKLWMFFALDYSKLKSSGIRSEFTDILKQKSVVTDYKSIHFITWTTNTLSTLMGAAKSIFTTTIQFTILTILVFWAMVTAIFSMVPWLRKWFKIQINEKKTPSATLSLHNTDLKTVLYRKISEEEILFSNNLMSKNICK